MHEQITVIIVDDKEKWRASVRRILSLHSIQVIAEANNGSELIRRLKDKLPDVILLDLSMPVMDGNETMEYLMTRYSDVKVVIVSQYNAPVLMEDYIERGVKGIFCKDDIREDGIELAEALRTVHRGGRYYNFDRDRRKLNPRQKEILHMIGEFKSNREIATRLEVSHTTISKNRKKIFNFFSVSTIQELTIQFYEQGYRFFRRHRKR